MARIARIVVPGYPHHITQRGNRRQETFFCNDDYRQYIALMAEWCRRCGVDIWAYCLMPNHTHLIAVPQTEDSMRKAIGEAHRRYARMINFREGWRGYLWQGRFSSFVMDERYLLAAVRYIELNPVRARLVTDAIAYPWSSARAHIEEHDDELVSVSPLLALIPDWKEFLQAGLQEKEYQDLRQHERTGRPLGSELFIDKLEVLLGRLLRKKKPGPKGPWKKGK
ncbi:MAG: transposase [Thermodesulfobacteriota bacterium]|nr:transposase [Thermodesulfobacteriota bacterium]